MGQSSVVSYPSEQRKALEGEALQMALKSPSYSSLSYAPQGG